MVAKKKAPAKVGRRRYVPDDKTRKQVQTLAGMGIQDFEIAKLIQVSHVTLRKYYFAELETGHLIANVAVAQSLFRMATSRVKPNVSAAIFWMKTRASWREDGLEEPGKKEAAKALAKAAGVGTDWEGLLQ